MPSRYFFAKIKQKEGKQNIKKVWDEGIETWREDNKGIEEVFKKRYKHLKI